MTAIVGTSATNAVISPTVGTVIVVPSGGMTGVLRIALNVLMKSLSATNQSRPVMPPRIRPRMRSPVVLEGRAQA